MFSNERAYAVVSGQLDVSRAIIATLRRVRNRNERREFLLRAKSLGCIGLRVGQFHEIERNSSIVVIHYVESRLLSLLIAF